MLGTVYCAVYHACRCCSLYSYEVFQVRRCNRTRKYSRQLLGIDVGFWYHWSSACAQQSSVDSFIFPLYQLHHKQHGNNTDTDDRLPGIAEAHVDYRYLSQILLCTIAAPHLEDFVIENTTAATYVVH
jgi:hypothetical protein